MAMNDDIISPDPRVPDYKFYAGYDLLFIEQVPVKWPKLRLVRLWLRRLMGRKR